MLKGLVDQAVGDFFTDLAHLYPFEFLGCARQGGGRCGLFRELNVNVVMGDGVFVAIGFGFYFELSNFAR